MNKKELDDDAIILDSRSYRLKYLEFERMLRDREKFVHKTRNGEYIKLVDMSDKHLDNAIKFFRKEEYEMDDMEYPDGWI